MKRIKATLFLMLFPMGLYAQTDGLGQPLWEAGFGARPLGMGGAFTAVADDANAIFWNAAGLGRLGSPSPQPSPSWGEGEKGGAADGSQNNLTSMYARLYEGTNEYFLSYARSLGKAGGIGISWAMATSGPVAGMRIATNPDGTYQRDGNGNLIWIEDNDFSYLANALLVGYGKSFGMWIVSPGGSTRKSGIRIL